jgi:hypothetical protein
MRTEEEILDKAIMALSQEYQDKPKDAGAEWDAAVAYCIGKLRVMQEQLHSQTCLCISIPSACPVHR